jgi:hypothetical protein
VAVMASLKEIAIVMETNWMNAEFVAVMASLKEIAIAMEPSLQTAMIVREFV